MISMAAVRRDDRDDQRRGDGRHRAGAGLEPAVAADPVVARGLRFVKAAHRDDARRSWRSSSCSSWARSRGRRWTRGCGYDGPHRLARIAGLRGVRPVHGVPAAERERHADHRPRAGRARLRRRAVHPAGGRFGAAARSRSSSRCTASRRWRTRRSPATRCSGRGSSTSPRGWSSSPAARLAVPQGHRAGVTTARRSSSVSMPTRSPSTTPGRLVGRTGRRRVADLPAPAAAPAGPRATRSAGWIGICAHAAFCFLYVWSFIWAPPLPARGPALAPGAAPGAGHPRRAVRPGRHRHSHPPPGRPGRRRLRRRRRRHMLPPRWALPLAGVLALGGGARAHGPRMAGRRRRRPARCSSPASRCAGCGQAMRRSRDLVGRQGGERPPHGRPRNAHRMARDLHDILGHSLTVIAVKAELAGRLVDVDPERARAEIADIQRLSRDALADVRQTVEGVRGLSLPAELARARSALQAAGIAADLPRSTEHVPIGRAASCSPGPCRRGSPTWSGTAAQRTAPSRWPTTGSPSRTTAGYAVRGRLALRTVTGSSDFANGRPPRSPCRRRDTAVGRVRLSVVAGQSARRTRPGEPGRRGVPAGRGAGQP